MRSHGWYNTDMRNTKHNERKAETMKDRKLTADETVWTYTVISGEVTINKILLPAGHWVHAFVYASEAEAIEGAREKIELDAVVSRAKSGYAAGAKLEYESAKRRALQSGATLEDFHDGAAN